MMRSIFLVGALGASIACAAASTNATGVQHDSNLITEQEVADSHGATALEVITRARPSFLKSRGKSTVNGHSSEYAMVYVDGQPFGGISSLRNIVAPQIHEIRYYNAADAVTKFGMQSGSGAIEIKTKISP